MWHTNDACLIILRFHTGMWDTTHLCPGVWCVGVWSCSLFYRALLQKRPMFLGSLFVTNEWCMFDKDFIQGGEDPWDVLSCRSFFAKEPLIIGLFCGEWPIEMRHPMTLRYPVMWDTTLSCVGVWCVGVWLCLGVSTFLAVFRCVWCVVC